MIIEKVWWRRITNNDLFNMEKPLPPGPKGQLHVDVPNVPDLFSFFGQTAIDDPNLWPQFEITAKCLRDPSKTGIIHFRPRPKNARYDIPQQNINAVGSKRHPAWTSAYGWPAVHGLLLSTKDAENVLEKTEIRIVLLQDSEGEYYADFVSGRTLPDDLPPAMQSIFNGKSAGSISLSVDGNQKNKSSSIAEGKSLADEDEASASSGDLAQPKSHGKGVRHHKVEEGSSPFSAKRQGYGLTGIERKAVESRAVELSIEYFSKSGYSDIRDVGAQASYDLTMIKDGQIHVVEVKGTTGSGEAIVLTRNEVEVHKNYFPFNALAVVSGISLARGENPVASGGSIRVIQPWTIEDRKLLPLTYEYFLATD